MSYFIQDALLDRLEGLEDVEGLKQIRHEPTRRLSELLTELDLNGAFSRLVRSISEGSRRRCPNGGRIGPAAYRGTARTLFGNHGGNGK